MMWMNANSLALAVIEWESRLAPELIEKPPVCIALADAYARAADWKGLKARIENATWGDMEFMRFAFLARTLERLDDPTGETAAWSNSLNAAQTRADWLEMLARLIQDWSWKQRSEEVLWKLAATDRCPRWAADFLWSAALAREDSAKLYEAAKLLVKLDPKSIVARNNYLFLALATDQTTDSPNDMAAALFKQNPKDVLIATTYGFSLFQQGKTAAAVAVMDAFSPEEVGNPQSALDYAIFLAAAGKMERAEEYFRIGAKSVTLPKERALVAFLAPACRAKLRQQSGDAAGAEAAWKEALAAAEARPEWVEMLGKMAIDWKWSAAAETVALKLASLERCPVWAAEALWTAATKTGDTAQIYRAGRLVGKVDPANLEVRNRYLGVALLGGHELEATQRQAAALARENPRSVELAATHGLALYQQGRADEALALMNSFTAEQLHQPSIALYQGLFLAATGRKSEAEPFLQIAGNAPLLREEKVLATQARDAKPPAPKPAAALPVATVAPPPIEPIDRTRRDTAQLFKDSREALLADPKNVTARSNYILLALLTDQSADSARQLARALYKEHAGDAAVAACYGLSLDQQGKTEEAIAAMETLKPEQLREPVVALYYGHFLAGSERAEKSALAPEFLALAEKAPLLPEERALLAKGKK